MELRARQSTETEAEPTPVNQNIGRHDFRPRMPRNRNLARLVVVMSGALGMGGIGAAQGSAEYNTPNKTPPNPAEVIKGLQLDAFAKAQPSMATGAKFELTDLDGILGDLQTSYTREPVDKVTLNKKTGEAIIRQKDMMATISVGDIYTEQTYPNVDPSKPPTVEKTPTKFFNAVISPDMINRQKTTVRRGYMTAKRTCAGLGRAVTLPSFDNYAAKPLEKDTLAKGDRVTVNTGRGEETYVAKDTTETFIDEHSSTIKVKPRKPLTSAQRKRGECLVIDQTSESLNPSKFGNLRERSRFVWVFKKFNKKNKSSKTLPQSAKIRQIH
jgi:hypothetical protein